jgi:holo-[acyl-carrier protein] synthase
LISGIGVDIVEIRRIKRAMERSLSFLDRVFDSEEIDYLKSRNLRPEFAAGRFAAKEAVVKAMGTGFRGFDIRDVVIERMPSGKPYVVLKGKAKEIAEGFGKYKFHLSISHGEDDAIAYAIMEVED